MKIKLLLIIGVNSLVITSANADFGLRKDYSASKYGNVFELQQDLKVDAGKVYQHYKLDKACTLTVRNAGCIKYNMIPADESICLEYTIPSGARFSLENPYIETFTNKAFDISAQTTVSFISISDQIYYDKDFISISCETYGNNHYSAMTFSVKPQSAIKKAQDYLSKVND